MNYEQLLARLKNDLPKSMVQPGGWEWWHWVILGVVCMIALAWVLSCFFIVRQKVAAVVERFGKFRSVRHAGINVKLPWPIDTVADHLSLQIEELKEKIGVKSRDNAFLEVPVKVQYQVIEEKVKDAYYELSDPEEQIMSYVVNVVRSKANEMTMDEIFQSKDAFETEVETSLNAKFTQYGYRMVNVLVDDPQPSAELKSSFDKVLAAKRDREASELEKDAIMNRIIGKATAEAESLCLKAKAYVEMRQVLAVGNSKALKEFCEGLEITHAEALRYFEGLDLRDAIRDVGQNKGSVIITDGKASASVPMIAAIEKAIAP